MGLKTLKTIQATMFKVSGYVSFCKNVNVKKNDKNTPKDFPRVVASFS